MEILNYIWGILPSVLGFIVIFSILVLIHECGHFFTALWFGVKVEEFGLGLPPRAKIIKKGKTGIIYSLNWLPLGGFVKMLGEDDIDGKEKRKKGAFSGKNPWQRLVIVLAGVFMNFVLAIGLLTGGYMVGMNALIMPDQIPQAIEAGELTGTVTVMGVMEDGTAITAGMQEGDIITSVNGKVISMPADLPDFSGEEVETVNYIIERNGEEVSMDIPLNEEGKIGIEMGVDYTPVRVQLPIGRAFLRAVSDTYNVGKTTAVSFVDMVGGIFTTGTVSDEVGGPVMIASMTHQLIVMGSFTAIIKFMALLSISLGIINLLPIPALDGGRAVFILFELITGKRANEKVEAALHQIFFLMLIALIFFITYKDIVRVFFGASS